MSAPDPKSMSAAERQMEVAILDARRAALTAGDAPPVTGADRAQLAGHKVALVALLLADADADAREVA